MQILTKHSAFLKKQQFGFIDVSAFTSLTLVSEGFCAFDENFWTLLDLDHGTPLAEMSHIDLISTATFRDISK